MKILYCALAIPLDTAHGGATHAAEVTNGLAALGHDLWVIGQGSDSAQAAARYDARVTLAPVPPYLAWQLTPRVRAIARVWQPDVIMERFYTFAGGGVLVARQRGLPSLLEVNAPVTDAPGTAKDRLDRATGSLMRRWATQQCRWARRIVTPLATTVPPAVRDRVTPLEWGANTDAFNPDAVDATATAALRRRLGIPRVAPVVGFIGSFRAWHGVTDAVAAFRLLRATMPEAYLLLVGDGPERAALAAAVTGSVDGSHIIFAGAVPHAAVPAYYTLCDVALAPFAPRAHRALEYFGFYWSPLKLFEAMAMRVPVVTTDIPRLNTIVAGAGVTVTEGDHAAMAAAIAGLLQDPARRARLGAVGRRNVIERYSWAAHCRSLDALLRGMLAR